MSTKSLKSLMATLATLSDENIDKVKEFVETQIKPTPDMRPPVYSVYVAFVFWLGCCWVHCWDWLVHVWHGFVRILCRLK